MVVAFYGNGELGLPYRERFPSDENMINFSETAEMEMPGILRQRLIKFKAYCDQRPKLKTILSCVLFHAWTINQQY